LLWVSFDVFGMRRRRAVSRSAGFAIEAYQYPLGSTQIPALWSGLVPADLDDAKGVPSQGGEDEKTAGPTAQQLKEIEGDVQRRCEAGRLRGFEEGRAAERQANAMALASEVERHQRALGALLHQFEQERSRYLQEVEQEVVELALAVAARILRRESQMDPLLLTGAVRVALGQLAKTTKVRLLVPLDDLGIWSEAVAHIPNLAVRPIVLAGEGMHAGDCLLETELGSVDLGIRAQLGEIERGFFDRTGASRTAKEDTLPEPHLEEAGEGR
jgi:flagellar assembly protein FliH